MYLSVIFIIVMHPCQTKAYISLKKKRFNNKKITVIPKRLNGSVMSQMPESGLEICCCYCFISLIYDLRIALLCIVFSYSRFNKDIYITLSFLLCSNVLVYKSF